METQRESTVISVVRHQCRNLAALAFLLGCTISAGAMAASSLQPDSADLQDLLSAPSSGTLSVNVVDLSSGDAEVELERDSPDETLAPLLYLAPRVASILEDVFDAEQVVADDIQETTVAPMAESTEDTSLAPEADDTLEVQPALMRIQRQMYRTDI